MLISTRIIAAIGAAICLSSAAMAGDSPACSLSPTVYQGVLGKLATVVNLPDANGGIFKPNTMWAVVVDRAGVLCNLLSVGDAWPGSRAIAMAKAVTANAFSNNKLALSTANLYGPTQPGGSLYGLNNSNPFNPEFLPIGAGHGEYTGGIITFGGGVALYENGKVIGGLGVSGDSSCADHSIAYRMRKLAKLDGIPGGVGPGGTDNILYAQTGMPVTGFEHPHCFPTDITP